LTCHCLWDTCRSAWSLYVTIVLQIRLMAIHCLIRGDNCFITYAIHRDGQPEWRTLTATILKDRFLARYLFMPLEDGTGNEWF
jgi:hypothetical protein